MPIDDLIGDAVGEVVAPAVGWAAEQTFAQIFSPHTARFLHGLGRRVIAAATFGTKRIPSSLRMVPKGIKPKPRKADWIALIVGLIVWIGSAAAIVLRAAFLL